MARRISCGKVLGKRSPGSFRLFAVWATMLIVLTAEQVFSAEPWRVLPPGELPRDRRLEPLKDLDGYFPFTPRESAASWQPQAEHLRRQMLVSLGIWPLPTRTPLNPVIHGRVDREEYTVERAFFESMPGFFVTGSLYRPKGKPGRLPGVLCPHGHWANGRFYDVGASAVKKDIEQGAEKFEEGGRSPLQARCVHLARMGCVVFHYDMIGYADSQQISYELAHRFAQQRPDMIGTSGWGFFSPQAESYGQSIMGLQTWNSIRALDFLTSLPDVDASRIGVTGASGGGTQTFVVCGVDPRPAVAFPAVMVSTAMQGGCTCENACGLRIDTGNVELAALFAPKPLGMSAANDWTKEMTTKGFPELQAHYRLLGAPDNVRLISRLEFPHNYNAVCREAMYQLFFKHLGLGEGDPPAERDYQRLSQQELTVWNDEHPKPAGGVDFERRLLEWWREDADRQLAQVAPKDRDSLAGFQSLVKPALDVVLGGGLPAASELEYDQKIKNDSGDHIFMAGLLRHRTHGEELPVVFFYPKQWKGDVIIWLHESGKSGLFQGNEPRAEVKQLVAAGKAVAGVDLLYQGEFLPPGQAFDKSPKVSNKREAAAYSFGYNRTVFAQRVHDILTVIAFVKNHERAPKSIALAGFGGTAGAWAAAARSMAAGVVDRAAVDTAGFRFLKVNDIYSPEFLPGGAKYGDLPGMITAAAPAKLWLAGESSGSRTLIESAYRASGDSGALTMHGGSPEQVTGAALQWLLKE
jgi:dienelactone hydrolase